MKKIISLALALVIMFFGVTVLADDGDYDITVNANLDIKAESAVLMEATTGEVLYSQNTEYYNSPASVTKIMTLLLVCRALEEGRYQLSDTVTVSEYASSMGGSQVFLKEGEQMTVEELLKCVIIASANDAAVALAEHTYGSEREFVSKMNECASKLGLQKTSFENVTGLDDDTVNHYTCAMDIATMSRELLKYDIVTKYSSLWQDSIRDGEFILTNTNRLVRFFDGCNGLKTGSTDKAGYCISATAKRGNMQLIAVIMNADSITDRNNAAKALLDYGFANYALYVHDGANIEEVPVLSGVEDRVLVRSERFERVVTRSDFSKIEMIYEIPENINAPILDADKIGKIIFKIGDNVIGETAIVSCKSVEKISLWGVFIKMLKNVFA